MPRLLVYSCKNVVYGVVVCLEFSWTQYMNQAFTSGEVGGTSTTTTTGPEDWMRAFCGLVTTSSGEADAATRCRSLTTISVSDLDQLDSYPGPASYEPLPAERAEIPAAAECQRLNGLPPKHRYKQTRNQAATSYRRR